MVTKAAKKYQKTVLSQGTTARSSAPHRANRNNTKAIGKHGGLPKIPKIYF